MNLEMRLAALVHRGNLLNEIRAWQGEVVGQSKGFFFARNP